MLLRWELTLPFSLERPRPRSFAARGFFGLIRELPVAGMTGVDGRFGAHAVDSLRDSDLLG